MNKYHSGDHGTSESRPCLDEEYVNGRWVDRNSPYRPDASLSSCRRYDPYYTRYIKKYDYNMQFELPTEKVEELVEEGPSIKEEDKEGETDLPARQALETANLAKYGTPYRPRWAGNPNFRRRRRRSRKVHVHQSEVPSALRIALFKLYLFTFPFTRPLQ